MGNAVKAFLDGPLILRRITFFARQWCVDGISTTGSRSHTDGDSEIVALKTEG